MDSEVNGIILVAHELKSPLSLMRQLALNLEEENLSHTREQIVAVSERAIRQVNDLTKIARLEDGLFVMEPVSIRSVCDDVISELQYLFRFNNRDLSLSYMNRSKLVLANRELLFSIIYNFCLNAMHYSDQDTESSLVLRDHLGKVQVKVRDFGPALPSDVWRELNRGWIKKPTSIAMRPGSSGLGLYIASKFAKYMNATIRATRHRDGTSFILELPISHQVSLFS